MPKKQPPKTEKDSFEETAKRLECEDDKEAFERKLGKIAKAKSVTSPSRAGKPKSRAK